MVFHAGFSFGWLGIVGRHLRKPFGNRRGFEHFESSDIPYARDYESGGDTRTVNDFREPRGEPRVIKSRFDRLKLGVGSGAFLSQFHLTSC